MNENGREFSDGQIVPGTRYRVLRWIGSGGMGSVYEVEHIEIGKRFVLKALLRQFTERRDLVARLRQEWRALGRLEHPNIVSVTDAGTSESGAPYYVMERLDGETLGARLGWARRLPPAEAVEIAVGVLEGLNAAHAIGVVHRDVKPPNIFLLAAGGVKLLDFGVAKIAGSSAEVVTARGLAIGTPRYMSPEQARGDRVDGRADLYAAGLILFEMIAGAGPFDDARDANELVVAHLTRPAPSLSSCVGGVFPELDEIVGALLEKDPRQRPSSARVVAEALRRALRDRSALRDAPAPDVGHRRAAGNAIDTPTVASRTTRTDATEQQTALGIADTVYDAGMPTLVQESSPTRSEATDVDSGSTTDLDVRQPDGGAGSPTSFDLCGVSADGSLARGDHTLTLEELGEAPRSVEEPPPTRTALPRPAAGGETPPPVESQSPPATRRELHAVPSGVLVAGAAVLMISAAIAGAWALHGRARAPEPEPDQRVLDSAPPSSVAEAASAAAPAPASARASFEPPAQPPADSPPPLPSAGAAPSRTPSSAGSHRAVHASPFHAKSAPKASARVHSRTNAGGARKPARPREQETELPGSGL